MRQISLAVLFALSPFLAAADTKLTFCYDPYPPYTFGAEGVADGGLKVALLDAVVDQIEGLTAEVILLPWKRCQAQARSGEVDGILPLFESAERESYLAFTDATFLQTSQFFYRQDQFPGGLEWTGELAEIANLRLGMVSGSILDTTMEEAFSDNNDILRARDADGLLKLLAKKRVDLIAIDTAVGRHTIERGGWRGQFAAVERPISSRTAHFGLAKASGTDRYVDAFNRAIATLAQSGHIEEIQQSAN
jgi:polar amino acid transport system substrate-binding protein